MRRIAIVAICLSLAGCSSSSESSQPDPASEQPDSVYCGGSDCRAATPSDPTGCEAAAEAAPYDPNDPNAGIPQDCVDAGY